MAVYVKTGAGLLPAATVEGTPFPAWVAGQSVTTASVRQAEDGSWIRSNADRTTGATFDAPEQAFWATVSATAGTMEQIALSVLLDLKADAANAVFTGTVTIPDGALPLVVVMIRI